MAHRLCRIKNLEDLLKNIYRDPCINMNNHQNAIFHQITNFLKTPLAPLGVDLKNFQFNKICHSANHPYLCKGLIEKTIGGDDSKIINFIVIILSYSLIKLHLLLETFA